MARLDFSSASALVASIARGEHSAVEVLQHYIARYEQFNPRINAIVAHDFEAARARAEAADRAFASGELWGPLHGLPITVKDNIEVKGMPNTYGVAGFSDYMPPDNADVANALLAAGAVIFGKTNMPAMGADTQTFNEVYGQTNNPWDLSRTPGGSSGGAAAALAAGMTPLEIGNDIGGSIRLPAHFCGVFGHKPSFGIVSMHGPRPWEKRHASYPLDLDLLVNGPMARSADDLMLAMDVIAGPPAPQRKAFSLNLPAPRADVLTDFRVAVWLDDELFPIEASMKAVLQRAIDQLSNVGVRVIEAAPPIPLHRLYEMRNELDAATMSHTVPNSIYRWALDEVAKAPGEAQFPMGWPASTTIRYRDWVTLHRERQTLRQAMEQFFEQFDLLLCPVSRICAHTHDHTLIRDRQVEFAGAPTPYWPVMGPWNSLALVAHLPATVAPVGQTVDGLPVGLQIIGPYLEDRTPIRFAQLLEQGVTGAAPVPPGFDS